MNYGSTSFIPQEAKKIVEVLGGGENAYNLLIETASAETAIGHIEDKTVFAGMGICQFDKRPFYYIKDKAIKRFRKKILEELGVDLKLVQWEHLRYNSYLSLIWCRLYYFYITPKPIPSDLKSRAKYWKKYYNSRLGKGTVEHYMLMAKKFIKDDIKEVIKNEFIA